MSEGTIRMYDPIVLQAMRSGVQIGPRGYSAYQVAVQNGFSGTVEEWLESLKAVNTFPKKYKATMNLSSYVGYPDIPAPQNVIFNPGEIGVVDWTIYCSVRAVDGYGRCGEESAIIECGLKKDGDIGQLPGMLSWDAVEGCSVYVVTLYFKDEVGEFSFQTGYYTYEISENLWQFNT